MPIFKVYCTVRIRGRNKARNYKVQAIGETHMRQLMEEHAKKIKKEIKIIHFKES